jgi:hypothetical protein
LRDLTQIVAALKRRPAEHRRLPAQPVDAGALVARHQPVIDQRRQYPVHRRPLQPEHALQIDQPQALLAAIAEPAQHRHRAIDRLHHH